MSSLTQTTRVAAVHTPLAEDTLTFRSMTAREQLGRLYSVELEVVSEKGDIQSSDLLGQTICIELKHLNSSETDGSGGTRYLHGYVNRFSQVARQRRYYHYQVTIVPWLWFLSRIADCRIYQNMTTSAILEDVFKRSGFSDYELRLSGHYESREYCVQYRETDFNFVSRLMEQEGIYYYFEHTLEKHTLVLADSPSAHSPFSGYESIMYRPHGGQHAGDDEHVDNWASEQRHHTGAYTQTDYDFTRPRTPLMTTESIPGESGYADLEVYDYPGDYVLTSQGQPWARARMEEIHVDEWRANATADAKGLAVGYTFTLEKPPLPEEAGEYLVVSAVTTMESGLYETGDNSQDVYKVDFSAAKAATQFRPARLTPKPVIQGVQTAVVTGPAGEEIYTDKYDRIKVQFYWDRVGKKDENTTCFIRVGQVWAGKRWGATFIPRIGQEVIVSFLEGDPDRPIVVGSVYNGDQMPPYEGDGLDPKHKNDPNISGIKSLSTKGGQGFNEWRFDDTKGKEEIFIHGERNQDVRIKNDAMENIGNDRHLTVGGEKDGTATGNQCERVYKDKHLKVHHDQVEQIGNNQQLHVGGINGGTGNQDIILDGTRKVLIKTDDHLHVNGDRMQKIDKGTSLNVGMDQQEKVGQNHALDAGMNIHLKAGMTCVIEAGTELTLKVGGNFIVLSPEGVTIVGTMVMINSGGAAGVGEDSNPVAPTDASEANPTPPTVADDSQPGSVSTSSSSGSPSTPSSPSAPKTGGSPGLPSPSDIGSIFGGGGAAGGLTSAADLGSALGGTALPSVPSISSLSSLTTAATGFFNCVSTAANKAGAAISQGKKTVTDAETAVSTAKAQAQQLETDTKTTIQTAQTAVSNLKDSFNSAEDTVNQLKSAAANRSVSGVQSAVQSGKNAVQQAQSAWDSAKSAVDQAKSVVNNAEADVKQAVGAAQNLVDNTKATIKAAGDALDAAEQCA